ncbi:hypothetical protein [Nakamurella leprariae]|uniref:Terminase large subunit gp17-like C-terminal domain-containing protein n=1 Tax=Nakamurella leprariae TaxID=2803911 RepID=A0A939BXZ5_9ACTN|nr:hypothetical protein [Nakamurella leprariae]MBM9466091.1 hypothetical protein [Nakamurella leprariae]
MIDRTVPGAFTVGLDLGQAADFSALCVIEHVAQLPPGMTSHAHRVHLVSALADAVRVFQVRSLKRWPLGTPYTVVAKDVSAVLASPALRGRSSLLYDATGVGRGVGDLLYQEYREHSRISLYPPTPVTITQQSKADMVSTTMLAFEQGRLQIAAGLPLGDALRSELLRFQQNIRPSGSTSYDIPRTEDGHGDLASALMVGLFWNDWVPGRDLIRLVDGPPLPVDAAPDGRDQRNDMRYKSASFE